MKLSNAILILQGILNEKGDIEVYNNDWFNSRLKPIDRIRSENTLINNTFTYENKIVDTDTIVIQEKDLEEVKERIKNEKMTGELAEGVVLY